MPHTNNPHRSRVKPAWKVEKEKAKKDKSLGIEPAIKKKGDGKPTQVLGTKNQKKSNGTKIRSLKRLIGKLEKSEGADKDIIEEKKKELALLTGEVEEKKKEKEREEREQKFEKKYKYVKFVDTQKVERKVRKLEKNLEGNEKDKKKAKKLLKERAKLLYIENFPKDERYISLFGEDLSEDGEKKRKSQLEKALEEAKGRTWEKLEKKEKKEEMEVANEESDSDSDSEEE